MVAWLIGSAVRLRRLVVAVVVLVFALGLVQLRQATVDVYPEYDPTQVQIQSEAPGLSALEVEQLITVPLEHNLLTGIPRIEEISSRSMPGLSVVDLTFEPGTELYLARQLVQERLTRVKLLPNVGQPPTMIQPTSSMSRVAMVGLRSDTVSLIDMSVLARWHVRPRLMSIPGVAQVSIWGLRDRQLQVQVDPQRLVANNVTLTQLIETTGNALWVSPLSFVQASTPGTGGFFESPNQRIGVQHISPVTTAEQLADVTVQRADGAPVPLGQVAEVIEDSPPLIGDATSGAGERSLMLVIERFPDADTVQVSQDVQAALAAMGPGLEGITVDTTVYEPAAYVDSALDRLAIAFLVGLLLMAAVLAVVTLSWRTTLVVFGSVAFSLLAAVYVLHLRDATLTTMTALGLAMALALVIDDAVGDAAVMRARFLERREGGRSAVAALAAEAVTPRRAALTYATVAVVVALAPLLLMAGTAGAFAWPVVLTFALAVLVSLVVALVVTPTLAVLLLAGAGTDASRVGFFPGWVRHAAGRAVAPSVGRRVPACLAVAALVALGVVGVAQFRPADALPEQQDRSVLVELEAAPGTSLPEMDRITGRAAAELRGLRGVASAGTHVGRAVGSDAVVNVESAEIWLTMDRDADYAETMAAVRATVAGYPGLRSEVHNYARAQLPAAGPASDDLVVRVSGQDFATLRETAELVRESLATVHGVITPVVELEPAQPVAEIKVDLAAAQRHGVQPGDVRRAASTLVSGLTVGSLYEQQAIFDVVVWGGPAQRHSLGDLEGVLIDTPNGTQVRLAEIADVVLTSDPTVVSHDSAARSLDVTAQVQGRDHADVARDATARLQQLTYPYQYRAEVVSEGADSGIRPGLLLAGGVAAVLVFLLFQAATGSWRGAAALFVSVPLAGAGGLLVALTLGEVGSVPVLAAVFAAMALAARQALVLVRRAQGLSGGPDAAAGVEAMRRALGEQAPAVLAAVLVTAAAVLPAVVMGGGAGLEIVHPFAATLLGGLATSTAVVLFVVPTLYPAVGAVSPPDRGDVDPFAGRHEARHEARHEVDVPQPREPEHIGVPEEAVHQQRGTGTAWTERQVER